MGLDLGPNDLVGIVVMLERLGDRKIPHGVGGEMLKIATTNDKNRIQNIPILNCL